MKYFYMLFLTFNLSGCLYQTINEADLRRAEKICGGVSKIEAITADFLSTEFVKCQNKEHVKLEEK